MMSSISMGTNGYGQYPVNPRKTKPVSEENQPDEQAPSSSYGVQGGKVALQVCGTLLGASGVGATAGWLTHQQEIEASKKNPPTNQPEPLEIPGSKAKTLTPAEIETAWERAKIGGYQNIQLNVFREVGAMDGDNWNDDMGGSQAKADAIQAIPKEFKDAEKLLTKKAKQQLINSEAEVVQKQILKSAFGVPSDAEWTAKVNEVKPKIQQMKNFRLVAKNLDNPDNWLLDDYDLVQHNNNKQLLKDALATNDLDKVHHAIAKLDTNGLDAEIVKNAKWTIQNWVDDSTTFHVSDTDILAYHNHTTGKKSWQQAKQQAEQTFDSKRRTIEAMFGQPAKAVEIETKAKQLWYDAEAKIAKELADAEVAFRASKVAPKLKTPNMDTLVETKFLDELFKGGTTTKVAGGLALATLLIGTGLTAYSAYQDGQRKPPAKYPNFTAEG
jgi:hypothetical protein